MELLQGRWSSSGVHQVCFSLVLPPPLTSLPLPPTHTLCLPLFTATSTQPAPHPPTHPPASLSRHPHPPTHPPILLFFSVSSTLPGRTSAATSLALRPPTMERASRPSERATSSRAERGITSGGCGRR